MILAGPRENSQKCVHGRIKAWEIFFISRAFFVNNDLYKIIERRKMHWIYLLIAGFFEISWAVGLKFSHGFTQIVPSVLTVAGMVASFYFLALALRHLPLGTAYAIWTGIGTIGTVVFGIVLFKEPVTVMRLFCIALIVCGITGLKLLTH